MTLTDVVIFLVLSLGITFLYFWLFRQYRIDVFRQRTFTVRDELFDYAASGKISFDHPAYTTLRNLMNGYIRFSHQISLFHVGTIMFLTKIFNKNFQPASFEEVWKNAISGLDKETAHAMFNFRMRAEMNLFYFLFLSSLFKKIFAIPMLIIVTVKFLWDKNRVTEYEEFRQYAYENTAERSPQVKHSIEYVNEDAYQIGQMRPALAG